jgi:hypothetical protein
MPGGGRGLQNRCGAVTVPGWFNSFPLRRVDFCCLTLEILKIKRPTKFFYLRGSMSTARAPRLIGIYFLGGVPEEVIKEIGEGEKGGWCIPQMRLTLFLLYL